MAGPPPTAPEPVVSTPQPTQAPTATPTSCPEFAQGVCGSECPVCEKKGAKRCSCDQYCDSLGDCCCPACQGLDNNGFDGLACPNVAAVATSP